MIVFIVGLFVSIISSFYLGNQANQIAKISKKYKETMLYNKLSTIFYILGIFLIAIIVSLGISLIGFKLTLGIFFIAIILIAIIYKAYA